MKDWNGETCKFCGRDQHLAWGVSDDLWHKVVLSDYIDKVLCLECFLEMAYNRGIRVSLGAISFYGVL